MLTFSTRLKGASAAQPLAGSVEISNIIDCSGRFGGVFLLSHYLETFLGDPGNDSKQNFTEHRR